jgi:hypothetical protein
MENDIMQEDLPGATMELQMRVGWLIALSVGRGRRRWIQERLQEESL